jgi:NifU-like protein involved in Fe-S cluster formation
MLTELVEGLPVEEAAALPSQAIIDELGIPLSAMRVKCAVLGLGTLKVALHRGAGTPLPPAWGADDDELVWG